jgi:hypothetical protein
MGVGEKMNEAEEFEIETNEFSIDPRTYLKARLKKVVPNRFWIFLAIVIIACVIFALTQPPKAALFEIVSFGLSAVILLALMVSVVVVPLRDPIVRERLGENRTFACSESGFMTKLSGGAVTRLSWLALNSVTRADGITMLCQSASSVFPVLDSAFKSENDWSRFLAMLQENGFLRGSLDRT